MGTSNRDAPSSMSSFTSFYAAHFKAAARLACLLTGSQASAADLAQDAMVVVQRRWDDIDAPAAFLRSTVVNLSQNRRRRWFHERRWLAGQTAPASNHLPEIDEIWSLLRQLPGQQRAVVVLRFYEDLSLAEIGELLSLPLGTVKSTLHRALARLREEIR